MTFGRNMFVFMSSVCVCITEKLGEGFRAGVGGVAGANWLLLVREAAALGTAIEHDIPYSVSSGCFCKSFFSSLLEVGVSVPGSSFWQNRDLHF